MGKICFYSIKIDRTSQNLIFPAGNVAISLITAEFELTGRGTPRGTQPGVIISVELALVKKKSLSGLTGGDAAKARATTSKRKDAV